MLCGLGGTNIGSGSTEHIQGNRSISQDINSCFSKDQQVCKLVPNNLHERYIMFALLSLGHDSYWKLAPFLPPIQEANKMNYLASGALSDSEGLMSLSSQPSVVYWSDLLNEKNMHDQTDSVKPASPGSPLRSSALMQPQSRKQINNSSTAFFPVSNKLSGSFTGSLLGGSDFLVDDLTKIDKASKRSPRKKGKKKGEQYRRVTRKKLNSVLEIPCEANIVDASPLEVPQNNMLVDKFSETSSSADSLLKYVNLDKDDSKNNNEYVDCRTVLNSSVSGSDEMDDSEPTASSRGTVCEGFSYNGFASLNDGSNAIEASEVDGSPSIKHACSCSREESNGRHKSSCASTCDSNNAIINSFFDSDIRWSYIDDVEARSTTKDVNLCDYSQCGISMDPNNLDKTCHLRVACLSGTCGEDSDHSFVGGSCCSKDITDGSNTERVRCSSEACSSNASLPVSSERRGRRSSKTACYVSLNVPSRVADTNNHNRGGKHTSVSVWQKVQKSDKKESMSRTRHATGTPLQGKGAQEDSKKGVKPDLSKRVKQNQSIRACKQPCPDDVVKMECTKVENDTLDSRGTFSRSLCKKQMPIVNLKLGPFSKQAMPWPSKNFYAVKRIMSKVPKNHSQQKEGLPSLQLVNAKDTNSGLLSTSPISGELPITSTEGDDNLTPENVSSQSGVEKATPGICSIDSDLFSQAATKEEGLSTICQDTHSFSVENKPISIVPVGSAKLPTDSCIAEMEENPCVKLENESFPQEPGKLDSAAGHLLQRWVPVGKEISNFFDLDHSKASGTETSTPNVNISIFTNVEIAIENSDVPASNGGQLSSASEYMEQSCHEDSKVGAEGIAEPCSSRCFDGLNCQSFTETKSDLNKIREAVSDAYKVQRRVEDIQLVNGRSLADFERFVYFASPVVGGFRSFPKSCSYCSQEWVGDNLCSHQIPDICLRSIWQWYEEPGCYGLGIKALDFSRSKGSRNSNTEFTAYFVPYLSAVQLFGRPKSTNPGCPNDEPAGRDSTSKPSPCLGPLPILAKLLPQQSNQRNSSSSFCTKDDNLLGSDGRELIFEYFESEQPPWRRPLFEKIKELTGGVKPSNCQISGDSNTLEYLSLQDLHPASWYCVAWYPIYRIPDGKFHAAFLTYHSLGHLVRRSSSSERAGFSRVVSPVVGLQSYNDNSEWWLQMSSSGSAAIESPSSASSDVLRARLQTLNQTAAVMARANLSKWGVMRRNTHPDYEFFQTRYR